jgi:RNA polymerase sigma factor (sigma-70 family)
MPEIKADFRVLMQQVREGSDEASREVVSQFGEQIRRAVRRALDARLRTHFDTIDFVQLVWSSLFRVRDKLDRFDCPEALAGYLATMARNKVGMELRRRLALKRRDMIKQRSIEELAELEEPGLSGRQPAPAEVAMAHEKLNCLLQGQSPQYRHFIHLRLQGNTHQDIADAAGVIVRTVRRFFRRLLHTATP